MMVNKKDRTGGQVRDESGDPVTVRVWRQETTGRQWDMLERTLFHDTSDRPIRVCIGACPSPDARSAPPQPRAGEEARAGGTSEGGALGGATPPPAPIHTSTYEPTQNTGMATRGEPGGRHETSTGGTGTTRILEHEDLEIDGGSTTEGGGGHQGVGMHQGGDGGGRAKRQREGSSRRVKTKKPREDPEGGSPSAYDSMD